MEATLPFEYGYLYKIVGTPNAEDQRNILNGVQLDTDIPYYSSNGYGALNGSFTKALDHEKFFHPIGFIESKQIVIVEVMVKEKETTSGHLSMSGMSFQQTNLTKEYMRIARAHVEVNNFIRNFEKVL